MTKKLRPIAFHLPQFHPIAENDEPKFLSSPTEPPPSPASLNPRSTPAMHVIKSLIVALLALGSLASSSAEVPALEGRWASAEFRATVAGTSTLHDWSVESTSAVGEIDAADPAAIRGSLRLTAKSLVNESDRLHSRMYAALKTETYP